MDGVECMYTRWETGDEVKPSWLDIQGKNNVEAGKSVSGALRWAILTSQWNAPSREISEYLATYMAAYIIRYSSMARIKYNIQSCRCWKNNCWEYWPCIFLKAQCFPTVPTEAVPERTSLHAPMRLMMFAQPLPCIERLHSTILYLIPSAQSKSLSNHTLS